MSPIDQHALKSQQVMGPLRERFEKVRSIGLPDLVIGLASYLCRQFTTVEKRATESILKCLSRVRSLVADLVDAGEVMPEDLVCVAVVQGLPENHETVTKIILDFFKPATLTVESILPKLLHCEMKADDKDTVEAQSLEEKKFQTPHEEDMKGKKFNKSQLQRGNRKDSRMPELW